MNSQNRDFEAPIAPDPSLRISEMSDPDSHELLFRPMPSNFTILRSEAKGGDPEIPGMPQTVSQTGWKPSYDPYSYFFRNTTTTTTQTPYIFHFDENPTSNPANFRDTEFSSSHHEFENHFENHFGALYPRRNQTYIGRRRRESPYDMELDADDVTWILLCSMIIFSMQTGFGLLEVGVVSQKNRANILMKNIVDVVLGGLTYWLFGFAMSYGLDPPSTSFLGFGEYIVDAPIRDMGPVFTSFFFQLSFATTATTIASGSMAERCDFRAYCLFSLFNTVVYAVPARWIWSPAGFLNQWGVIDIAGSGGVHLVGGVCAFVAAWMLGPRLGRYDKGIEPLPIRNSSEVITGFFMLWWAWVAFNSGSTFGITGEKWKFAARATVTTMLASIGGGVVSVLFSFVKGRFEVLDTVNAVLGGLVGITAPCALVHALDALIIGAIGGFVVLFTSSFADRIRVDDPIGATAVHGFGGIWGLLAVGLFAEDDRGGLGVTQGSSGVFRGGGWRLLGVQAIAVASIIAYVAVSTFIILWIIDKFFFSIRMKPHEEILGADFVEHHIRPRDYKRDYPSEIFIEGTHAEVLQAMKNSYEMKFPPKEKLRFWSVILSSRKRSTKNAEPKAEEKSPDPPEEKKSHISANCPYKKGKDVNANESSEIPKEKGGFIVTGPNQSWQSRFSGGKPIGIVDLNDPANYYYPEFFRRSFRKKKTYIWME